MGISRVNQPLIWDTKQNFKVSQGKCFSSNPAIFPLPSNVIQAPCFVRSTQHLGEDNASQDSRIKQEKPFSTRICVGGGRTRSTNKCPVRDWRRSCFQRAERSPYAFYGFPNVAAKLLSDFQPCEFPLQPRFSNQYTKPLSPKHSFRL